MGFVANSIRFPAVQKNLKIGEDLTKLRGVERWELFLRHSVQLSLNFIPPAGIKLVPVAIDVELQFSLLISRTAARGHDDTIGRRRLLHRTRTIPA